MFRNNVFSLLFIYKKLKIKRFHHEKINFFTFHKYTDSFLSQKEFLIKIHANTN